MGINIGVKRTAGWIALIVISLIPVYLWFHFGPGAKDLVDYGSITHSLGELFGLVGMTMFALTFVLSTRAKFIEDIFGGLDKAYIAHGILGGTALVLILSHPIFLVLKFVPSQMFTAALYLLPSAYWSVNFGIIALLGMVSLIYITLFTKMKYHKWKFTHEFLGLMFFIAVLHIFLVRGSVSSDKIFSGYYYYATAVSIIGLGAFVYSLFIKNRITKNAVYTVEKVKEIGRDSFEIILVPEHKPISYKSGQFVFLRVYNHKLSREAHPFSIASKSNEYRLKVIVKRLGDFTENISHIKEGDRVSVEGPYGRFNFYSSPKHDQIWVAAGIGITPFLGLVDDLDNEKTRNRKIDLYYSVKDDSDVIGIETLKEAEKRIKGLRVILWKSSEKGRIDAEKISSISGNLNDKELLICGPSAFKEGIMAGFSAAGVPKKRMHEEAFDFR